MTGKMRTSFSTLLFPRHPHPDAAVDAVAPLPLANGKAVCATTITKSWPLVLIADNSHSDVHTISEVLNSEYRIKVARSGGDALAIARRNPLPDLILLEMHLPDMDGMEICRCLKQSTVTRDIPVIFVTAVHDELIEALALDMHAADYITKPYSIAVARARIRNKLAAALEQRNHTAAYVVPPAVVARQSASDMGLARRQLEVLALIAEGLTSAEIAEQLAIAKGTVEVHRENIMRKLGVHNIAGLIKCAIRHGLLNV